VNDPFKDPTFTITGIYHEESDDIELDFTEVPLDSALRIKLAEALRQARVILVGHYFN
jgi:hypothetical protein